MTYRVNDIFYSLQGEGRHTGRAAVFVRFAGCNLRCSFCDTDFSAFTEMSADDIVGRVLSFESRFVVLTGGEPTLQVDETLVERLHEHGCEVAMESNGTLPAPSNLDWLTVSPKGRGLLLENIGTRQAIVRRPDELKIVFDETTDPQALLDAMSDSLLTPGATPYLCLQPCDTGDAQRNKVIVARCVDYIKHHPQWRLSLQTHKLIDIP